MITNTSEDLETRIGRLKAHSGYGVLQVYFVLGSWHSNPEVNDINTALKVADNSEKLELTKQLYTVYTGEDKEHLRKIFGEGIPRRSGYTGNIVMGTIANNGSQFRIWYELPDHVGKSHVGSCMGQGLVLCINGHPQDVGKYIHALMPIPKYIRAEFANGVEILMNGSY